MNIHRNKVGHQTIILKSNNIDKSYREIKTKAKIILKLTSKPWGKTFIFTDPSGNNIEVLEA